MFEKFMPKFKVLEPNNLTGLRNGQMLAQSPAYADNGGNGAIPVVASKTVGDYKFIENGIVVGLSTGGIIENFDPEKHFQPFVHFTEELVTGPLDGFNQFAIEVDGVKASYPRCIGLYVGDTFTTDNFVDSGLSGTAGPFKVVNGILTYDAGGGAFYGKKTTLANGQKAYEFTFVGLAYVEVDLTVNNYNVGIPAVLSTTVNLDGKDPVSTTGGTAEINAGETITTIVFQLNQTVSLISTPKLKSYDSGTSAWVEYGTVALDSGDASKLVITPSSGAVGAVATQIMLKLDAESFKNAAEVKNSEIFLNLDIQVA